MSIPRKQRNAALLRLIGLSLICIGAVVIWGWIFQSVAAVQILPNMAPMQMNTALCFLLAGLSLLTYKKNTYVTNGCVSLIGIMCALTIIEYLFDWNVGIDDLLIEPFVSTKTSHPGRMAPNTALSFIFFVLFVVTNQMAHKKLWFAVVAFPCIMGILGAISLAGYVLHIEQAYAWGALTHMALHTSVAFLFLSCACIVLFFNENPLSDLQREMIYDASIFTFVMFFCFVIWLAIRASMVHQLKEDSENFLDVLTSKLVVKIKSEIEAITRIFERQHAHAYSSTLALKHDVDFYFKHMPFLLSLNFKPSVPDDPINFMNTSGKKKVIKAVNKACESIARSPKHAHALTANQLYMNATSFLCVQKFRQLAVINLTDIVKNLVLDASDKFNISIEEAKNQKVIFHNGFKDRAFITFWLQEKTLTLFGTEYVIKATPHQQYIKSYVGQFPFYALSISVLLAVLILIITKNKHQLIATDHELKYSEKLNFTLLNAVGESIIGINQNYYVNFMNQSAQDLLHFTFNPQHRIHIREILKNDITLDQKPLIDGVVKSIVKGMYIKNNIENIVTQIGTVIPVSFSSSPIILNQTITGALIVLFDMSERVKYEDDLKQIALYDQLTHLPNRYSLIQQLEVSIHRAQRSANPFALCFIDVNQFKKINDTYGHHIGDMALKFVAKKISGSIRKNDFLGRLAGDEFCLIFEGVKHAKDIERSIAKIRNALLEPFSSESVRFTIQISIGYAIYFEGATAEELMMLADQTMYHHKIAAKK